MADHIFVWTFTDLLGAIFCAVVVLGIVVVGVASWIRSVW